MPDTLTREAEVVAAPPPVAPGGARTLTVQLFRWDDPRPVLDAVPELRQYRERWARDSIPTGDGAPRLRVFDTHHGEVVGHVGRVWDAGPGPHAEVTVADTARARDVLALIDAGTTAGVSVEFQPRAGGEVWNADRTEVTRTAADLTGLAFAFLPAHDSPILATRENTAMPDATSATILEPAPAPAPSATTAPPAAGAGPSTPAPAASPDAVRGELDQLRQAVVELGRGGALDRTPAARYRSLGDAMQGAVRGELRGTEWNDSGRQAGVFLTRALVDQTTADAPGLIPRPQLAQLFQAIVTAQPLVEAAGSVNLPDSGMDVSYPFVSARPSVAVQTTQKTAISSTKLGIARQTVPVVTFAGGEDDSMQLIQRSDPSYLTIMGQLYAEAMAIATDTYAYSIYDATVLPAGHLASIGAAATGWVAALAALQAVILKDSKRLANRMVVSVDLWQKLVGAADADGRPLFPNTAPTNPAGDSSLTATDGNIRGLTWSVDPNFPADRGVLFNSSSFVTALGPVQTMTADNPGLVGRDYAMFRFGAVAAVEPAGMAMFATGTAPTTTAAEADEDSGSSRSRK